MVVSVGRSERALRSCRRAKRGFRLAGIDPGDTLHFDSEDKPRAQDRWSVLLIFQAMDAAGKDGAIKHVLATRTFATSSATWRATAR